MNQEIKQKWIEALRSGRYKQGRLALRREDDKYCCLGVLCDILDPNGWLPLTYQPASQTTLVYPHLRSCNVTYLPSVIADKAELDDTQIRLLAFMNDGGQSFVEIADYIEVYL